MRRYFIASVCAALGLGAAWVATSQASDPVTLPDLPGLGYSLSLQFNAQTGCGMYVVVGGNGVDHEIVIGDLPPACATAQEEADRIAALLAAYPPVTTTTTTAAPTTLTETVHDTTTEYVTTAEIVTAPAVTLPAVTVASPPEVYTVTETVVQTVTTPLPDPDWLVALGVRSTALNAIYGLV